MLSAKWIRAIFLTAGCALFAYLLARLNPARVLGLLLAIGWSLVWIVVVYAGHQFVRTAALRLCMTTPDRVPYRDLVKIRVSGETVQFLTFTGPFLAEPAKAMLLHKYGMKRTHAFAAVVCEFLIYTFLSAAMAVTALAYLLHGRALAPGFAVGARIAAYVAGSFLAAAAFAILRRFYLIGAIVNGIRALPGIGGRVPVDPAALRETEDLLFVILRDRPGRFLAVLGVEAAAQLLLVAELWILLSAARQTFSPVDPLLIESTTKFLAMAAFFIPGQIGAAEGLYAAVFGVIGLPAAAGFSLALARRLRSFLMAGIGLVFLWRPSSGSRW